MAEWMVPCFYCGDDVDAYSRLTYHRVEGWERKGRQGGSDIVARTQLGLYAHPRCVDDLKNGRVGQESLAV